MTAFSESSEFTLSNAVDLFADALPGSDGVIYCRTAAHSQITTGLLAQEAACRAHLRRIGIDPSTYVAVHDEGVTGRRIPDALTSLLERVGTGEIKTLVVTDLSRISRSDAASGFVGDVVRRGGRVIVVADPAMAVGYTRFSSDVGGGSDADRVDPLELPAVAQIIRPWLAANGVRLDD